MEYRAPHDVQDEAKLASLVEAFRTGQPIPPIVVFEDMAICGSHRIAAQEIAHRQWGSLAADWDDVDEPALAIVELDADTAQRACEALGDEYLGESGDWNDVCDAAYDATDDQDVRAALEDQRELREP